MKLIKKMAAVVFFSCLMALSLRADTVSYTHLGYRFRVAKAAVVQQGIRNQAELAALRRVNRGVGEVADARQRR